MPQDRPVVIVGAGAAGLAAAAELNRAGRSILVLEARNRLGGRMFTVRDPAVDDPIELGAEFIHGKPPEILGPLRRAGVAISEVEGDIWCMENRRLAPCEFFPPVDSLLNKMDDSSPDESFVTFLARRLPSRPHSGAREKAKQRATAYVSGFNAADPALVGVHWLVKSMRAEEKIEGHRAFRAKHGYAELVEVFRQRIEPAAVQTETVVERIKWKPGQAELAVRTATGSKRITASRVLITLPLAVLRAPSGETGAVKFEPGLPRQMINAFDKLEMGKVIRVVLRFRDRFWERIVPAKRKSLARMSFLLSEDEWFPTWWTAMPHKSPIITGWAPFRCAARLSGLDRDVVVQHSLRSLSQILNTSYARCEEQLEASHLHDWQSDPFSRGAYSYAKVGADGAQETMSTPVENTLFFAGEATDTSGHNGTVHGAIASGRRAAAQILRTLGE